MDFALVRPNGRVRQFVTALDAEEAATMALDGERIIPHAGKQDTGGICRDGAIVYPDRTLPERREARWIEARAFRNARQEGGCATPLGRVNTDADSQRKIAGAALAAMVAASAGQPLPIQWTMEDNRVVTHDGPAMLAMGMAVTAHLAACQDAGTAIRELIEAAEDQAALDAIDITAGYPA